jgi:hypothetical protein
LTLRDHSLHGNDGTITGATEAEAWASPAGLTFDGTDDYVSVPYTATLAPTIGLTLSAWVNVDWAGYTTDSRVIAKTESGGYQLALNNPAQGSDNIDVYVYRNGAYGGVHATRSALSAGWHLLTATFDGQLLKLYIDGVLQDTNDAGAVYPITYAYANHFVIGAEPNQATGIDGQYITGALDDLLVYSRALPANEVALLHRLGPGGMYRRKRRVIASNPIAAPAAGRINSLIGVGGGMIGYGGGMIGRGY